MRKVKGKEIDFKSLQMSDYLKPNSVINCINDKKLLFSLRNKTSYITNTYNKQINLCLCKQEIQELTHVYECKMLCSSDLLINYNKIYNGTLKEQGIILRRMKINITLLSTG